MLPILVGYFDCLETLQDDLHRVFADLPEAALNWSPGPDINSIAVLVAHASGALRYWIGDVIGADPSCRVREAEFRTRDATAADLIARFDAAVEHSRNVLQGLAPADLDGQRTIASDGRPVTVAWALAHALEHTAMHVGHAQIARQWWEHSHAASTP